MRNPVPFPDDQPAGGYRCDQCGRAFHSHEHGDVYRALQAFNDHACESDQAGLAEAG